MTAPTVVKAATDMIQGMKGKARREVCAQMGRVRLTKSLTKISSQKAPQEEKLTHLRDPPSQQMSDDGERYALDQIERPLSRVLVTTPCYFCLLYLLML